MNSGDKRDVKSGHRYMKSADTRAVEEWTHVHEQC